MNFKGASATIFQENEKIFFADSWGEIISFSVTGEDDADIIQKAVDSCGFGGTITILKGKYKLKRSVIINNRIRIHGEGRNTEIVPPQGDYAFRLSIVDGGPHRGYDNFDKPVQIEHTPTPGNEVWKYTHGDGRLYGVVFDNFCIRGSFSGKGIYMQHLMESRFLNLWIVGIYDGAALYFDHDVMECDFENIHCDNTGSPANKEASIVIRSENGDSCNNLHFKNVYIIFPQYKGIEIGDDGGKLHPRMIYFNNCMVHGWFPVSSPAPYDLVAVNHTEPTRGIFFHDCRITNSGEKNAYFNIKDGQVRISGCVIGGGNGTVFIKALEDARVNIVGNQFQDTVSLQHYLYSEGAQIVFNENIVQNEHGQSASIELVNNGHSIISGNRFLNQSNCPAVIVRADAENSGSVIIKDNIFTNHNEQEALDIERIDQSKIIVKDNVYRR